MRDSRRYPRLGRLAGPVPRACARETGCFPPATNRIDGAAYDLRGNLVGHPAHGFGYDALNRQIRYLFGGIDWNYVYDGAGERVIKSTRDYPVTVPRREIARYILQARGEGRSTETCNPAANPIPDVPCTDSDWGYIRKFMADGYSSGCTPQGHFCPDSPVTRAQLAVLLVRGRYGPGFVPPPATGRFNDVPPSDPFAPWIEKLAADGVTSGCSVNPPLFCPNDNVTEWQMQVFIRYNGFWNLNPVPAGSFYTYRDPQNRVVTEFADWKPIRDNVFLGNVIVGSFVAASGPPAWHFYSSDHLGSPRLTTDLSLQIVDPKKYWPYGLETAPPTSSQRLQFCAMERDVEANTYYDHARSYELNLGRFLSPDTLQGDPEDPQSWNRYAYVLNNPLKYTDPVGLWPMWFRFGGQPPSIDLNVYGRFTDSIIVRNPFALVAGPGQLTVGTLAFFAGDFGRQLGAAFADSQLPRFYEQRAQQNLQQGNYLAYGLDKIGAAILPRNYLLEGLGLGLTFLGLPQASALKITFRHGARHLAGTGLSKEAVEAAIRTQILSESARASATGSFWGRVTVAGQTILYKAYTWTERAINVGTYWRIP